jgi:hypothetical protein
MDLVAKSGAPKKGFLQSGGLMNEVKRNRKIWLILMSLFLLVSLPVVTSAQGRGRGRGQEKKVDRFVNGHDARDGRWDGRGPRFGQRTVISNVVTRQGRGDRFRYRDFERNERFRNRRFELRRRGFDNDSFLRWQRQRYRHRRLNRNGFYSY